MNADFDNSPKDEAVVNHSDAGVNEKVTNGHDVVNPIESKYDKPGRETDPDTTKQDPDWDQPNREENDKSGNDDDNDKTGTDTDNDKTAP
ncbi:MAG: hypothetical protein K0Q95_2011 [Bacteroidota bacterium]|jgi:hypothetical protein|nr:hypothetical protein [Bacteroidota bacterium]